MPRPDATVYLAMPGYGQIAGDAARAYWRATRMPDARVHYAQTRGSLLASNFNHLWCGALNLVHGGGRLDYFAMQHSDVQPPEGWLDELIDELDRADLDVLGVAVPIKDGRGLTSLAVARPDGDPWRPLRRLTLTEVHHLPETFGSADVGGPLLINTGLWVCRFDPAWARKVRFTINDRIVFDRASNCFRAEVEPEDWYFSRLCHEMSLRVGATRKIPLTHRGEVDFPNHHPWGEPDDADALRVSGPSRSRPSVLHGD